MSEGEEAAPEQWWVPGRLGGMREGTGAGGAPRARRSPRRAGKRVLSWLSQGFERILPQPEGMKKPEVSAAQLGKTGGWRVEMRVGRALPCLHPPAHPSWDPGEESPEGIQLSKKRLWVLSVFLDPDAGRTLHVGPTCWCQQRWCPG